MQEAALGKIYDTTGIASHIAESRIYSAIHKGGLCF